MRAEHIDWETGEVEFWDLDFLDPLTPLSQQREGLKEDLAQVRFGNGVLIDVGWYPEGSVTGEFVIRVITDTNWDEPLLVASHRAVEGLVAALQEAVTAATLSAPRPVLPPA
ncbi:MAG TPA: hypothetical protein PKD84_08255 [Propionicimonas sp.]|jgi:hypothetical protein|nr:hypothetical protein [Propionicimonas sp.]